MIVHIGYGLDDGGGKAGKKGAQTKLPITQEAEQALNTLGKKYNNFKLVFVGNTHRKTLVSDDSFAVTTSFNWLSFKGDPREKPRDEYGELFRKKQHVEKRYEAGITLLEHGYMGAGNEVKLSSKPKPKPKAQRNNKGGTTVN